jgi:ABC-2 type transport system permease protein/fluoroquinolone transport system permease protein
MTLLLLVLSSAFMTLFSLAVAVFYRSLSEWFFVGVAVLVINSLPMISYGMPSFAPTWLTYIPSYPTVFATRDLLFHGAGWSDVQPVVLYLAALTLVAFAAAYMSIRYRLLKEGR